MGAYCHDPSPSGSRVTPHLLPPVARTQLPNETWAVELGLKSRFSPAWTYAGFAASVVVGLIVGLLVLAALLASARHLDLLEALLPKHVIHSLHKGTVVAEFLPEVATLFAGASVLDPGPGADAHRRCGAACCRRGRV